MASPDDGRKDDEDKEMDKRHEALLEEKKALFRATKETDEKLLKIRQEETAIQKRQQEKKEMERVKRTLEDYKNENAYLKAKLQSAEAMSARALKSESKVERLEVELRRMKEKPGIYEQEHGGAGDANKTKVELETLRHQNSELSAALRKMQEQNQRITKTQEREVAKLKDEIRALKQISAETQQRQLSELQSTSSATKRQQQSSDQADVLRAMYDQVSSTIDAQSVARNMFQSNALTLKELQSIQSKHSEPVKAAEELLNIVMNQSGNVYSWFLDALKNTGYQNVFEIIVSGSCKDFDAHFDHTQTIREYYLFLVDNLDSKHSGLVGELFQAEVFNGEEMESVNSEVMSFRQNEKLLSILSRKTKDQFDKFLDKLDTTGQQHVRNHISGRQEEKPSATEVATQQEDIFEAHQVLQQQLKEANDTVATLTDQLKRLRLETSRVHDTKDSPSRYGQAAEDTPFQQTPQDDTVERYRQSYLLSAANVLKKIATGHRVVGVTSVNDEVFALLERDDNKDQVAVYSLHDYQLLRHLNVPGYKTDDHSDMTSCVRYNCLYLCDPSNNCIVRYDLRRDIGARMKLVRLVGTSNRISKWPVGGMPLGLSVITPSCNLLVTCGALNTLVELRGDNGERVREIALESDINYLQHGIQLTDSQFVLCHGWDSYPLHRVCIVGEDGTTTRSYGGERGSDVGQLDFPRHLAVDKDSQFIIVADCDNRRVVLLSPTLEFVRYVSEDLSRPCRLYFHQSTRRLFVCQHTGTVTVIQL